MMIKKITLLALVGALLVSMVAGTAVAKPAAGKGPKAPKKEKTVTYVFQGTVAEVTQAGTDPITGLPLTDPETGEAVEDGVVVDVKQGNKAAKSYVGQQVEFAVDSATKIERNDTEAELSEIQQGDKVMVQVKAPASTSSFTARLLNAEGPEPAPAPTE